MDITESHKKNTHFYVLSGSVRLKCCIAEQDSAPTIVLFLVGAESCSAMQALKLLLDPTVTIAQDDGYNFICSAYFFKDQCSVGAAKTK